MTRGWRLVMAIAMIAGASAVAAGSGGSTASAFVAGRCYPTAGGDLQVCHDPSDQGPFFDTPSDEVAYSVQRMQVGSQIHSVFHTESVKYHDPNCKPFVQGLWCHSGDSIKVATGADPNQMPSSRSFVLWGQYTDPSRYDYYGPPLGVGGAANPSTVKGAVGDPYYYTYYLGVRQRGDECRPDRLGVRNEGMSADQTDDFYRHYLLLARTLDFVSWEVLAQTPSGEQWLAQNSSPQPSPAPVRDADGSIVRSNSAMPHGKTQGLIGSISYVDGVYYFFYVDYVPGATAPGGVQEKLYVRTATDISHNGAWSPAREVSSALLPVSLVRVAKAAGMDRWVVVYNCFRQDSDGNQDLCVQYTRNLDVFGPGGLSDVVLYDSIIRDRGLSLSYLGLNPVGTARSFGQPYMLTDEYGNLPGPTPNITWTDFTDEVFGAPLYWTKLSLRDGRTATLSAPGDGAVLTGVQRATNPLHTQTGCDPALTDPTCWRFDVDVIGPLSSSGTLEARLAAMNANIQDVADIYQVTAFDSGGNQITQARHVGHQCTTRLPGNLQTFVPQEQCPLPPTTFTVPLDATPDGHVTFVVMAEQAWWQSEFRLDIELSGVSTPGAPTLSASGSHKQVSLSWTPPGSDGGSPVTGYRLYRGTSAGGGALYKTFYHATTSFVDTSVTPGRTYYYALAATNAEGEGPRSNEVVVLPRGGKEK